MAARATSPFVEKEYDELDRKIDGFLGRIGAIFRFLVVITVIGAVWYYFLWPTIETWASTPCSRGTCCSSSSSRSCS